MRLQQQSIVIDSCRHSTQECHSLGADNDLGGRGGLQVHDKLQHDNVISTGQ